MTELIRIILRVIKAQRPGAQRFGRLRRNRFSIQYPSPKNTQTKTPAEGQIRCSAWLGGQKLESQYYPDTTVSSAIV